MEESKFSLDCIDNSSDENGTNDNDLEKFITNYRTVKDNGFGIEIKGEINSEKIIN